MGSLKFLMTVCYIYLKQSFDVSHLFQCSYFVYCGKLIHTKQQFLFAVKRCFCYARGNCQQTDLFSKRKKVSEFQGVNNLQYLANCFEKHLEKTLINSGTIETVALSLSCEAHQKNGVGKYVQLNKKIKLFKFATYLQGKKIHCT